MEKIRKYLAQKLRLFDSSNNNEQSQNNPHKVLRELSIDGIVEYIKEKENCKIITMAGAGISTCEFFLSWNCKNILYIMNIIFLIIIF